MVSNITGVSGILIAVIAVVVSLIRIRSYRNRITTLKQSAAQLVSVKAAYEEECKKVQACNTHIQKLSVSVSGYKKRLKDEQDLTQEKITELEKCTKQLSAAEIMIERQDEKSSFVADVVNAQPEKNTALDKYKHLVEHDYQAYANNNDSLAEEALAMKQLLDVQNQLELIAHDTQLLGKTIVAIGGAFSSGKSSFMNSFFMQSKVTLPVGMDQTTAVASYVMHGAETEITGYSYIGGKVSVPERIFSLFSYGKEKEFKFNMKRIIDQIVFKTTFVQPFEHICFIDTPGFNPGSNSELDYDTAITAIANAQVLLWCFDVNNGTIHSDELSILQDITDKNPEIKIYIVANRADLKSAEENEEVLTQTEILLDSNFIQYEGINLYTSREKYTMQPAEYTESIRKMPLTEFLENCNRENTQKEQALLSQVQGVFDGYISADNARIRRIERQIKTFNTIESSFAQIAGQKDEIIAYYKARRNTKFKADKAPIDDDEEFDKLTDSIAEIKTDLQKQLQSDKADITAAKTLSKKFCTCIRHIFKTGGTQAAE